ATDPGTDLVAQPSLKLIILSKRFRPLVARSTIMRPTAHHNLTVGFLCSLVLVCLGCKPALALDPGRDLSQFNRQIWLTENGLPQNTVHSITQARDGYVWLATEEGLARFDGIR